MNNALLSAERLRRYSPRLCSTQVYIHLKYFYSADRQETAKLSRRRIEVQCITNYRSFEHRKMSYELRQLGEG